MPRAGFELTIPASKRSKTVHALGTVLCGSVELPLAGVHFFPMQTNTCLFMCLNSVRAHEIILLCLCVFKSVCVYPLITFEWLNQTFEIFVCISLHLSPSQRRISWIVSICNTKIAASQFIEVIILILHEFLIRQSWNLVLISFSLRSTQQHTL
jgi:hypothetical protein